MPVSYSCQDRKKINGIERLDKVPLVYIQLIFSKDAKAIQWRNELISTYLLEQLVFYVHKMHYPCLAPYKNINSKLILSLNVFHKTVKLLQENLGENFFDFPNAIFFRYTYTQSQLHKRQISINLIPSKLVKTAKIGKDKP